jgi:anaerobic magnesium-protoporphyrin IX monomethyl ester cyclase
MGKPITPKLIDSVFKKTIKAKLTVQANFIFGDIAETKETAKETLNWWIKNAKGQIHLLFIQPYPGSKIYNYCLNKGIIKNKEEFIKNTLPFNKFNMTEKMTDKELNNLRRTILKLTQKYRKHIIPKKIEKTGKNIYNVTVKCPYCKNNNKYCNCLIKNKLIYGFNIPCRECGMLFYTVGYFKKIGFQIYPITRHILDNYRIYQRKIEQLRTKYK